MVHEGQTPRPLQEKATRKSCPQSSHQARDHFKRVNDTHGHAAGDLVLKAIADHLRCSARESDLVFRYGGEEFLLLLPDTSAAQALRKVDCIRQAVEASPVPVGEQTINITLSAGVATFPADGATPDALIERADQALYLAKSQGRNRVVGCGAPVNTADTRADSAPG